MTRRGDLHVSLFDDLEALAAKAAGDLGRAAQISLYDRLEWFRLSRDHVLKDVGLVAANAVLGSASAWLLLADCGDRHAKPFASWYTLRYGPIFGSGTQPCHRLPLLCAIGRALRSRFDSIVLAPVAFANAALVEDAFSASGWWAINREHTGNWIANVADDDFDSYWRRRPSQLRNTVQRKKKNDALTFEVIDRYDAAAWADYEDVYRASWKPSEGSPDFLKAFAQMEGRSGTLRLGIARVDGRAVAGQLWTVENRVATIHKLAHLDSARSLSPGTLLTEAMLRHVIDRDRPALIDYGTGDDRYKSDWMDERRALHSVKLYNRHSIAGNTRAVRAAADAYLGRSTR